MEFYLLLTILAVNLVWVTIWYYRKTQTLEYKIKKFVNKEKMKPRLGKKVLSLSSDAMVQSFFKSWE